MSIQAIVDRCSQFTGWRLVFEVKEGIFTMWDPREPGKSLFAFGLFFRNGVILSEVYGRTRHVGLTLRDNLIIAEAIRESLPQEGTCTIQDWDGTLEKVQYRKVGEEFIVLYPDGVCHAVSESYFNSIAFC